MENSHIEWTNHTFNPWWGCMKVSEGCKNCYAESLDNRYHHADPHWGPNSPRKPMSEAYWQQPFKWDAAAKKRLYPAMVFCASMADVFEDHADVVQWRKRLLTLIEHTPNLIWQLLTKRPENILKMVPEHWAVDGCPDNVWIGTSVENQKAADERILHLLRVPAAVRFLSCEPLLGPVDLTEFIRLTDNNGSNTDEAELRGWGYDRWSAGFDGPGTHDSCYDPNSGISWVICGGESGHGARPMHPDWARSLRDQCKAAGVPFFFKQWGEYMPVREYHNFDNYADNVGRISRVIGSTASGKAALINQDNSPLLYGGPEHKVYPIAHMQRVGKKAAGSLLDGKEYKEFPNV